MKNHKEWKKSIVEEVSADKAQQKQHKEEINAMAPEQQKMVRQQDKTAKKEAKQARKKEIKQLPKPEKKAAKKHDKAYKKIKARPRRLITWAAVVCVLAILVANVAPIVEDINALTKTVVNTDTAEGEAARAIGEQIAAEIADEGIVLLRNEENILPLQNEKINVFGASSVNVRYGGAGSGSADESRAINLYDGLEQAGISYNEDLYEVNKEQAKLVEGSSNMIVTVVDGMLGKETAIDEPPVDYLTDEMIKQAQDFSDTALVVISSAAIEASDVLPEEMVIAGDKLDLLEKVTQNFENVVVVVNAGNAIQLDVLDDYDSIKGILWVGTPGTYGFQSLGKILAGDLNPSGRLVDTYAHQVSDSPASVNFGDYKYDNLGMSFINYNEGIYVGYRFYETYYAGDEKAYQEAVQFPFGYGLSYTTFEWDVKEHSFDEDSMKLEVEVKNTGNMAGKDVVEAYFSAPYYEGGIEKSAIELAGYAKTSLLKPDESEIVTIEFDTRDMSSYSTKAQAYMLEKGEYKISVSKNVHDPVKTFEYNVKETVIYDTDEVTGTKLENQFDYAEGDLTYLSRNDWEGTWPDNSDLNYTASQELLDLFNATPAKVEGELPTMGAENGIMLEELKGLDYDDAKWEEYLDQFTFEQMNELISNGAYKTMEIEEVGLPGTVLLDGPAGISFFFGNITSAAYPTEVVIASTWNDELAYKMGEAVGAEANAYGVQGWYAPGMNIHRTAQGGRNFEYYSEDPLLSGKMGAAMVAGAQSKDIIVFIKHFVLNDQETNARSGIAVWADEQAIRELYLRPFEITVKEANATGVMSSFSYIGHKWAGGNENLLQNVLHDEWGFEGIVSTDIVIGPFMDTNMALRYGSDLMLHPIPSANEKEVKRLYKEDPVGVATGLRNRVHNICYAVVNYTNIFD